MALDPEYLDAIKKSEGYAPNASWDYKQYSSGYGTKAQPGDENIPQDQRQAVYEQRFQDEVGKAAASVDAFNPNLPPGVRAALTSLTYNAGPGWQQSGLGEAVKAGDWDKARTIFLQYNHAGGQVDSGLTARRNREAAWFGAGQPTASPAPTTSPAGGILGGVPTGPLQPPATPVGAPLQITPQLPPTFPQQAPQQASQQPGAGMDYTAQMPTLQAPQAPPIFYAPRRAPNISKLQAALGRAPIFPRG